MALEEYNAKRDFRRTAEPPAKPAKAHRQPIFVVQEHHASQLHYDFRLEADGVLKSWAVPKGPSLDPAVKRLAVQVEDHPLAYANFTGTIAAGQYGAGQVFIWDRGTYDNLLADKPVAQTVTQGIAAGRLEFAMHGQKLNGRFTLIRMAGRRSSGKANWLLIKNKDEFARAESEAEAGSVKARPEAKTAARAKAAKSSKAPQDAVELTHPDKVWFPEAGITKGEVFDFYRRIAPKLLPHLRERPNTLERLPDGLTEGAPHFWQKNTPDSYPDWVPRIDLPSERGKPVRYVLVNDLNTLLYLVNQGALTFHVWMSRVEDLDRPDFVLFDLDPGEAEFADVIAVARQVHAELETEELKASVKTSGKTGLHVLVPWEQDGGYDEARAWALEVAERVVQAMPGTATTERSKAKRRGRVYVDVMQNARGHHVVPPYVLRAVPDATVSMPLAWRELTGDLNPARFTPREALRRLSRQKSDPMAALARGHRSKAGRRRR